MDSVDWRTTGAVSEPMVQGECGSCWAITAAGALESANFIARQNEEDERTPLSAQQLIDCTNSKDWGNYGCDGGFIDYAYSYSQEIPVVEADDYPYNGSQGSCQVKRSKHLDGVKTSNHWQI